MITKHDTIDERQLHEVELPELPEGIRVPDDLSGLEHPDVTPTRRVRWMRWMAPLVVVGLGVVTAVLYFSTRTSDQADTPTSAYTLIQGSIDQALAEHQPSAYTLIQGSIDQALAEHQIDTTPTSAYTLIQDSIDQALAEHQADTTPTSAYTLIQDSIDQALAEHGN